MLSPPCGPQPAACVRPGTKAECGLGCWLSELGPNRVGARPERGTKARARGAELVRAGAARHLSWGPPSCGGGGTPGRSWAVGGSGWGSSSCLGCSGALSPDAAGRPAVQALLLWACLPVASGLRAGRLGVWLLLPCLWALRKARGSAIWGGRGRLSVRCSPCSTLQSFPGSFPGCWELGP